VINVRPTAKSDSRRQHLHRRTTSAVARSASIIPPGPHSARAPRDQHRRSTRGGGRLTGALLLNSGVDDYPRRHAFGRATTINGADLLLAVSRRHRRRRHQLRFAQHQCALTLSATSGNQIKITPVTFASIGAARRGGKLRYDGELHVEASPAAPRTDRLHVRRTIFVDTTSFANAFTGTFSVALRAATCAQLHRRSGDSRARAIRGRRGCARAGGARAAEETLGA